MYSRLNILEGTASPASRRYRYLYTALLLLVFSVSSYAQTPITLYQNFAGKVNYLVIGGTLRCCDNAVDPNSVVATSAYDLAVPNLGSGTTILAAYLYWAGSSSTADNQVTLNNTQTVNASRTFSLTFDNGTQFPYFSGFADVTTYVQAQGNRTYTFGGLTVNTGAPYSGSQAVVAGWGMIVVYQNNTTELKRSVNIYDGFQVFYGSTITFNPGNFFVPYGAKDAKMTHLTWEGDQTNSGTLNGITEELRFNGTTLSDANNPVANQFNSVSSALTNNTATPGVDIDQYDVSSLIHSTDTSATSYYASGGDMVLLSAEVISIVDTTSADLQITKTHTPIFSGDSVVAGQTETFTLSVYSDGPDTTGTITVTDTIPTGMRVSSTTGSGWTVDSSAKPIYKWTRPGPNPPKTTYPNITVTTLITHEAYPSNPIVNKVGVSSPLFDRRPWNNYASNSLTVKTPIFLTSTKTMTDLNLAPEKPRDTLVYTIVVKNTGNWPATNATLVDTLPTGVNIVAASVSPSPASINGQVITFNPFTLTVGQQTTFTYRVKVDSSISITPASNHAHVQCLTVDQLLSATFTPVRPVLFTRKSVDKATGIPGDTLTYTIRFGNIGNDTAKTVVLLDTLPANTTYVSGSLTGTGAGATRFYDTTQSRIRVTIATLPYIDTSRTVTFKVRVNTPITVGANTITNKTIMNAPFAYPSQDSVSSVITATVNFTTSSKTYTDINGGSVVSGDSILYTVKVKNTGNQSAVNVVVTDTLSPRVKVKAGTISNSGTLAGQVITWPTVATLLKGDSLTYTVKVVVDSLVANGGTVSNIARIVSTGGGPQLVTTSFTVTNVASLFLRKTVDKTTAIPGDTLTYTLKFGNTGTDSARTVVLLDTIPTNGTYVTSSLVAVPNTGASFDAGNNRILIQRSAIAQGDTVSTVTFKVRVNSPLTVGTTILKNAVTETAANGTSKRDSVNTTVTATVNFTTSSKTYSDLNGGSVVSGDSVLYTIKVKNTGNQAAVSVVVTDTLPARVKVKAGTISNSGTQAGQVITWPTVASLLAGDSLTYTVKVILDSAVANGAAVLNTGRIVSTGGGPQIVTTTFNAVNVATLFLRKTVDKATGAPGDTLTYSLRYGDIGTDSARTVQILDTIPANTAYVTGSVTGSGATYDSPNNRIVVNRTVIAQGDTSSVVTFKVRVNTPLTVGTTVIKNAATETSTNGTTKRDSVNSTITATVNFSTSTKTLTDLNGGPSVISGDSILYTIKVRNTGNQAAVNVVVADTLPSRVKVKAGTITPSGTQVGQIITWPTVASLAVGDSLTYTVKVVLDSLVANGATVTNTGRIVSTGGGPQIVTASFNAVNVATLFLRKTVDKATAIPGDTLTYTLKYGNTGTDSARTVSLLDTIPSNTSYVTGSVTGTGASFDSPNNRIVISRTLIAQGDTSSTATFKVRVNSPLTVGTTVIKNAVTETATNGTSKRDSVNTSVTATVNFTTSSKTYSDINGGSVVSGDSILYTVKVRNTGNQAAVNVVVADTLSPRVKVKAGTITPSGTQVGQVITWPTVASLAAGDSLTYTLKVVVDSLVANGGTVLNTARIASTGGGPQIVTTSFTVVNVATLFLRKTVDKATAIPGDTLTYTLKYGNTGTDSARTVSLLDTIPSNTSYVTGSVTGTGASFDTPNNRIVISRTLIAQGDTSSTATFKVRVNSPLTVGTTIVKNAVTETATNGTSKRDSVNTTVTATVNFTTSSKTYTDINGGSVVSGDSILYTVKVRNTGNQAAVNVVVADTLSPRVKVKAGTITPSGTQVGQVITWPTIASLAAGDSLTYTLKVVVDSLVANGGTVINTARIASTGGGPQIVTTSFTVVNVATLFLRKTVDKATAIPGDTLTYTLKYGNTGTDSARTVSLLDTIPSNTSYVTGSATGTGASFDTPNNRIVVSRSLIAQGDTSNVATFKVRVNTPLTVGTTIVQNAVTETATNGTTKRDSVSTNVTATVNFTTSSKTYTDINGGSVVSGDSILYTVKVRNTGNQAAVNVVVADTLSPRVKVKAGTITPSGTQVGQVITWPTVASLAAGDSLTYTLKVVVDSLVANGGTVLNTARIASTGGGPQIVTTSFTVVNVATLFLRKTVDKATAIPGDTLTYTLKYGNTGTDSARTVSLLDTIPSNTSYVTGSVTGTGASFDTPNNRIVVSRSLIAQGDTSNVATFKVRVNTPLTVGTTIVQNAVTETATNGTTKRDSVSTNVTATVNFTTSSKTYSDINGGSVVSGDSILYTVKVRNTGNQAAVNVVVADTLSPRVKVKAGTITPSGTQVGQVITWPTVASLAAGDSLTYTLKVVVDSLVANGGTVLNTARIASTGGGPQIVTTSFTVVNVATLFLHKTVDKATAIPGDTLTYTLKYGNTGTDSARTVSLLDTIPSNTSYVTGSVTGTGASFDTPNNRIVISRTLIAQGDTSSTATFKVRVNSPLTVGTTVIKNAVSETAANGTSKRDSVNTSVTATVNFSTSSKSYTDINGGSVVSGDSILYTVKVRNTGNQASVNVVVADTLSPRVKVKAGTITPSGTQVGQVITWPTVASLAVGDSLTYTLKVVVDSLVANGGTVINTARIASTGGGPQIVTTSFTVVNVASLFLRKTVDKATAIPGDTLTYTLKYGNTGTDSARTVSLLDSIPSNTSYVTGSVTGTGASFDTPNNRIVVSRSLIAQGDTSNVATFKVRVNTPLTVGTTIVQNAVTETAANGTTKRDSVSTNVSATVNFTTSSKTYTDINGGSVVSGDSILYTVKVRNTGNQAAVNVVVADTLSPRVKVKAGTITPSGTQVGQVITWPSVASLAVGDSLTYTLKVVVDSLVANGGTVLNTARIASTGGGPQIVTTSFTVTNIASLFLRKSVDKATAIPGDTLTYTLKYGNIGTDSARTVSLLDTIPSNTTYITGSLSGTGASYDAGNNRIIVSRSLIAQGDTSSTATFKVRVNTPLTVGTTVIKNAVTETATNGTSKRDSVNTSVTATVNFTSSSKTYTDINGGSVVSGDSILYTVKVRNTGNQAAVNVVVADTLSPRVKVKAGTITPSGTQVGQVITWPTVASLAAGDSLTYTLKVVVDSLVANGGTVLNTARIASTGGGPQIVTTSFTVVNVATLFLRKTVDKATAIPGDTLTYTLKYGNTGTDSARTVSLLDTIPSNTSYVTGSVTGTGASFDAPNNRIVVSRSLIAQGDTSSAATFKVRVNAPLTVGTTIVQNAVTETATNGTTKRDSVSTNVTATVNFTTSSKTYTDINGGSVVSGDSILYTVKVRNTGNQAAVNVVVADTLSPRVKVKAGTITPSGTQVGQVITWPTVASLAAGDSLTYTLKVVVDSLVANGGTVLNTARIASTGGGPQIVTTSFTVTNVASLFLRKTVDKATAIPGDTLTYTLKYGNTGTDSARTVSLLDTIPSNTSYVTGSVTGTGASFDTPNNRIVVSRTLIAQGDTSNVATFKVRVNTPLTVGTTIVQNAVTETAANGTTKRDSVSTNVTATVNFTTSSKTFTDINGGSVVSGDSILYTVKVRNTGNQAAVNVVVADTLSPRVKVKAGTITPSGTQVGQVITWPTVPSLAAGDSLTYTLKVVVDSLVANGGTVLNTARIASTGGGPQIVTTSFTVVNVATLFLRKTVDKATAIPGDTLTYTLKYGNTGTDSARTVSLLDTIPSNTSYVTGSVTGTGASFDTPNNRIVISRSLIAQGDTSSTATFKVRVNTPLTVGTTVIKNAVTETATNGTSKRDSVNTSVNATVDFTTSSKTYTDINGGSVVSGDSILYTVKVRNTGNQAAVNVVVADTLSPRVKVKAGTITPSGTQVGQVITWPTVASLAVGDSLTYTLKVVVDSLVANGGTVINTARIASTGGGPQIVTTSFTVVNVASLFLRKTVDKATAIPGDTLTYTLKYGNTGTDSARTVSLLDTIPSNTSYVTGSVTGTGASFDTPNNRIVVSRSLIAQGDTGNVATFKVRVNTPLTVGTTVIKNAVSETATNGTSKRDSVNTSVTATVNFSTSSKSYTDINGGSVVSGDSILYTVKVRNTGNQAAVNVVVADTLSPRVKVKAGTITPSGTQVGQVITWPSVASLAVGDSLTYTLKVVVDSLVANGGTVLNTARIASTGGGPQIVTTSFTVVNVASLFLRKTVDKATTVPGDTLTYTLKYGNVGTDSARTVSLLDTIPSNTSYVTGSVTGTGASFDTPNNRIIVSRSLIAQGDTGNVATFRVRVNSPLTVGTTIIKNAVTETATNGVSKRDSVITSATATVDFTTSSKTYQDLNGGLVVSGDSVLYTVKVRNTGNQAAVSVVVTDTLPSRVHTKPGTISGSGTQAGQIITWPTVPSLAAGDSLTYTVKVILDSLVANGASVTNTARIVSTGGGPQIVTATFTAVNVATLFLRKTVNHATGTPGDTLTYTLKYGDIGTDSAHTVQLLDTIPANATYVTGSVTGAGATFDTPNNRIVVNRSVIAQGDTSNLVTFKVRVNSPLPVGSTTITNRVAETAVNGASVYDSTSTVITAVLTFTTSTKTYTDLNGGFVASGDSVLYTITVRNSGNQAATSVAVNDTLPLHANLKPGTISGGGSAVGRIITWPLLPTLASGDSAIYTLKIIVDSTISDGATMLNVGRIAANTVVQIVTASFTVVNRPAMTMTKTADKPNPVPGDTVLYVINYKNIGTTVANFVTITDPTPGTTAYVPNSTVLNGVSKTDATGDDEVVVVSGSLTINIGSVQPGQTGTLQFKARVR